MMAGGSKTPDDDDADRQCVHCGLWWDKTGLHPHEQHCDMAEHDVRLVSLSDPYALWRADDVDFDPADVDDDLPADPLADVPLDPADDPVADDVGDDPGGDPGVDPTPARTDGGPRSVPTFGGSGDDVEETDISVRAADLDDVEERNADDDLVCGSCGGSNVEPPGDALPERALDDRPEVEEFAGVCCDCSTDDDGNWQATIEVVEE